MSRPFQPGGPPRFAHQLAGLRKLIETRGRCALLFDPGLGKTAVALDYASILALKSGSGEVRVLTTAPLAAIDTWTSQAMQYVHPEVDVWAEALSGSIRRRANILAARGGHPFTGVKADLGRRSAREAPRAAGYGAAASLETRSRTDPTFDPADGPGRLSRPRIVLVTVNLEAFSSRAAMRPGSSVTNADLMVEAVKRFSPDLFIVDESHRIKGVSSNTSRALARLTSAVPRRLLLTGTVMPHSPLDVYGQWRFLAPSAFGKLDRQGRRRQATFGGFKHDYAQLGGYMGKQVIGFHNLDRMQEIMAQNSIVARKEDALDLPPTTDVTVQVDLSPAERRAYAAMKKDLAAQLADGSLLAAGNRLTQMMRLRQITSGFIHDNDTDRTETLGHSKARVIRSIVHDNLAGERRIVVFAHFRREIADLTELLRETGTEIEVITGATDREDRRLIRKRFGSDDPARIVLIAQTRTMSLAINELVTASHAVFASLSLQRDDMVQARDRLNRLGQTRPVTFWTAIVPGTVDAAIQQAHLDRTGVEDAVLAHIRDDEYA